MDNARAQKIEAARIEAMHTGDWSAYEKLVSGE